MLEEKLSDLGLVEVARQLAPDLEIITTYSKIPWKERVTEKLAWWLIAKPQITFIFAWNYVKLYFTDKEEFNDLKGALKEYKEGSVDEERREYIENFQREEDAFLASLGLQTGREKNAYLILNSARTTLRSYVDFAGHLDPHVHPVEITEAMYPQGMAPIPIEIAVSEKAFQTMLRSSLDGAVFDFERSFWTDSKEGYIPHSKVQPQFKQKAMDFLMAEILGRLGKKPQLQLFDDFTLSRTGEKIAIHI